MNIGPHINGVLQLTNSLIVVSPDGVALDLSDGSQAAGDSLIYNNTFIGGQIVCQSTSPIFASNIIVDSSINNKSTSCTYSYNLFSRANAVSDSTNIIGDPKFVDATNRNYHLTADSSARDAASPDLTMFAYDFDGTPRPQGPRYDIGAFEFIPPVTK